MVSIYNSESLSQYFLHTYVYVCLFHIVQLTHWSLPTNLTALEQESVAFSCSINGTDIINATWINPAGVSLNSSSHIITTISSTGVVSTLNIPNVQWPYNHGWYTCRCYAENITSIASIQAMAYLHVQGTYTVYVCTCIYVAT